MRPTIRIATLSAAALLAVSPTAGAVQTPAAFAHRPTVEVARGAPVRVAGELDWYRAPARHARAWGRLVAEFGPRTWAVWDRDTHVVRRIWGAGLPAPGAMDSAVVAERTARALLERHISLLAPGASAADFVLVANDHSGGMRTLGFVQRMRGLDVEGGQVSFRFKNDRLFMIGSEALPDVPAPAVRGVSDTSAADAALAWVRSDLAADARVRAVHATRVLPLVRAGRVDYATVVPVEIDSQAPIGRWRVYVDAVDGRPVARVQTLRFATGTVLYNAPVRQPGGQRQDYPANQASLTIAGMNVTSGADGVVMWGGNAPTTVTTRAQGTQVDVNNDAGAEATANLNLAPNMSAVWNAAMDQFVDAQLATFVHGNIALEFMRNIDSDLPYFNQQLDANVNMDDTCNAFYNGQSINFFRASQQCNNTGRIADIVYHEFGHGVHDHAIIQGVGNFDPALSEGVSDYLAATITGDPAMAVGFFINNNGPLRHLDPPDEEAKWPDDIDGDTHVTGLIIGQALWDLRKALEAEQGAAGIAHADHIYYESIRRAVDIPSMYFEALAADDDDGNLDNGTPNMCLINDAFGKHGLFGGGLGVDVSGPTVALPLLAEYEVTVALAGGGGQCAGQMLESADLTWRLREDPMVGGVIPMIVAPDMLSATIPQQPEGSVVQYQVTINFQDSSQISFPENLADPFYEFFVGAVENIYCTDFETDPAADGWTHGLSQGQQQEGADDWMWQEPMAPPASGDPQAAFDGARVYGNDLGGGNYNGLYQGEKTNFTDSPVIDTTGYSQVRLQYRRWLTVEDGFFDRASIYANGGAVWQNFASPQMNGSTHHTDREWRFHDVDLTDAIENNAVTLKYELASDQGLHMGGWTLDALCVVGVVDAPPAMCGDGIVSPGEECDDGQLNSDSEPDACRTDCAWAACGDGVVDTGEECDDGNFVGGDGCSPTCSVDDDPTTGGPGTTGGSGSGSGDTVTTGGPGGPDTTGDTSSSSGGDTDTDTGGQGVDDGGCGCRQDGPGGAALSTLGLLLLGLGRRRRPARR